MNGNGVTGGGLSLEWFKMMLALLAALVLALLYVFIPVTAASSKPWALLSACIPSDIVALIAIPTVYLILYKRGLTTEQKILGSLAALQGKGPSVQYDDNTIGDMAEKIAQKLTEAEKKNPLPQVLGFHDSYRDVDWKQLLLCASQHN